MARYTTRLFPAGMSRPDVLLAADGEPPTRLQVVPTANLCGEHVTTLEPMDPCVRDATRPPRLPTPARFLLAGGAAAAVNFCSRVLFSLFAPFAAAIVLAYLCGMTTAFLLNRHFVFATSQNRLHLQVFWFTAVNMLALAQTLLISLLLARIVLPKLGITWHGEEISHAVGIAIPIFTSYVGHQRLTFR